MAQDVIYPGEGSVCTWEKGEIHCFGFAFITSIKGETKNNKIIVGDFNTPLTPTDRSTKQKINKETHTLNNTIDQLDLIPIGHFIPKQWISPFSQAHMEPSPG